MRLKERHTDDMSQELNLIEMPSQGIPRGSQLDAMETTQDDAVALGGTPADPMNRGDPHRHEEKVKLSFTHLFSKSRVVLWKRGAFTSLSL